MSDFRPMRAWSVYCELITGKEPVIAIARSRGKATIAALGSARDAGYDVSWTDFRAVRAPRHDAISGPPYEEAIHSIEQANELLKEKT